MKTNTSLQNLVSRVADRLSLRNDSSALTEKSPRPLVIEALEPRILFSGSPAPAPEAAPADAPAVQESAEAAPEASAPAAEEAPVAAPPAAAPSEEVAADAGSGDTAITLTDTELSALTEAASSIWASSGLTEEQAAALSSANYQIADLGGNVLGSAEGNLITIDDDAAGRGWFVDTTPEESGEFELGSPTATASSTGGIDLLSVLLHEQGHLLGLDGQGSSAGDIMFEVIGQGERRLPEVGGAAGALPGSLEGIHLLTLGPVTETFEGGPAGATFSETGSITTTFTATGDLQVSTGTGYGNGASSDWFLDTGFGSTTGGAVGSIDIQPGQAFEIHALDIALTSDDGTANPNSVGAGVSSMITITGKRFDGGTDVVITPTVNSTADYVTLGATELAAFSGIQLTSLEFDLPGGSAATFVYIDNFNFTSDDNPGGGGGGGANTIVEGDPLIPAGLSSGDTFQLIFVSENKIQRDLLDGVDDGSDNTTVADWDSWVNLQADSSTLAGIANINWSAVVSLPGSAANAHAVVGAPVYLTDGMLVANDFADMWDGSIAVPILINEHGAAINTAGGSGAGRLVWTGATSSGGIDTTYPLGNGTGDGRTGNSPSTSGAWIQQGAHERRNPNTSLRVYALSDVITVVSATPPATTLLSDSFESPDITVTQGVTSTDEPEPDGWFDTGHPNTAGIIDESHNGGQFTTPYGDQGLKVWQGNQDGAQRILGTLEGGKEYTVTFNVVPRDGRTVGDYRVQLVTVDGATVNVLGEVEGTVNTHDMSHSDTFTVETASAHPDVGKELRIRMIDPAAPQVTAAWQDGPIYDNLIITVADAGPSGDTTAPTPDPSTWDVVPVSGANYGVITMTASAASDPNGVQYYFENTTTGANSGWQDGNSWTESSLDHGTTYGYRVQTRDFFGNIGGWSSVESATTLAVPAGTTVDIDSFESPDITGSVDTPNADGWLHSGHPNGAGIIDVDTGSFTTPYGDQALKVWQGSGADGTYRVLGTLEGDKEYTVTFQVAARDGRAVGDYRAELFTVDGTGATLNVLATAEGTVSTHDMSESDTLTFAPGSSHPDLGQELRLRFIDPPSGELTGAWQDGPLYDYVVIEVAPVAPALDAVDDDYTASDPTDEDTVLTIPAPGVLGNDTGGGGGGGATPTTLAFTNFDTSTIGGSSNIKTNLDWVLDGLDDPGDLAALNAGGSAQGIFDGNAFVQDIFIPGLNTGNGNTFWTTDVPITVAAGSNVTLTDVTFNSVSVNGGQAENVDRENDYTLTLLDPSGATVEEITVADIDAGTGAGQPLVTIDFTDVALTETGTYTLRIKGGDFTGNNETGNHTGLDNLSINGTVASSGGATITTFDAVSANGAAVTVNPDGSFSYDPTGSATLQALNDGEMLTDTFTYTISDGSSGGAATALTGVTYVYDGSGAGSQPQPTNFQSGLISDVGNVKLTDGALATGGWNDGTHVGFRDDTPDDGTEQPQVTFDLGGSHDVQTIDIHSNTDFAALDSVLISTSTNGTTFDAPTTYALTFSTVSGKLTVATIDVSALPEASHYRLDFRQDTQWAMINEVTFNAPSLNTDTATVSIKVNGVNDGPNAVDDDYTGTPITEDDVLTVNVDTSVLLNLDSRSEGDHSITADGQTFDAFVDQHDGKGWLLIGRGREGWEFDTDGQGNVADVNQGLGTSAAFAPAAYTDAMINDLLTDAGLTMADVEIRISRASDPTGTNEYQDVRWRDFTGNGDAFTWNIEDSQYGVTVERVNAPAGLAGAQTGINAGGNTRDYSGGGNDADRVFTWAWGGHSNQKSFSYGQGVANGANNTTSFLWESGNENHAVPYAEVYIRALSAAPPHLLSNDSPANADIIAFDAVSTEGAAVTVNPDGSFTYDPTASTTLQALNDGDSVDDTFTYTITDSISVGTGPLDWNFSNDSLNGWTVLNGVENFSGNGISASQSGGNFAHDGAHETFLVESPEFRFDGSDLDGTNALIVSFDGGQGQQGGSVGAFATPEDALAFNGGNSATNGLKGLALLNTATGQYDATFFDPGNGGGVQTVNLAAAGLDTNVNYRLHFYENDQGSWGWTRLNQVRVAGGELLLGDTDTATVTITVDGVNDAPVAVDDDGAVTETADAITNPEATGNVLANDTDVDNVLGDFSVLDVNGDAGNLGNAITGTYGSVIINSDGSFTYTLDDADPDTQALQEGEEVTETFEYTMTDGGSIFSVLDTDFANDSLNGWTVLNGVENFSGNGISAAQAGGNFAHDGAHETLLVQSPTDFTIGTATIDGTNALSVVFDGGQGSQGGSVAAFADPAAALGFNGGNSATNGLKGLAFYNVGTGQYDATVFDPGNGGGNQTINMTGAELDAAGVDLNASYRLHYYENDQGSWGWTRLNSVQVANSVPVTDTATLTVTVTGANDSPVATDNTAEVIEDNATSDSGNVITDDDGNGVDSDVDSPTLSVADVDGTAVTTNTVVGGTHGDLTISSDGSYTYDLDNPAAQSLKAGETVTDTFTYTVSDVGGAGTLTAGSNVLVSVNNANFNISVFDGKAGYDNSGTSDPLINGVFGDGTVLDYNFIVSRNGMTDPLSYADGGAGLTPDPYDPNPGSGGFSNNNGQQWANVWTTSDPGTNYNTAKDFVSGSINTTHAGHGEIQGTIDISGLEEGTVYFPHGTFVNNWNIALVMSGAGQPDVFSNITQGGNGPGTNFGWITDFSFADAVNYDTITYTYTNGDLDGSRARFMGVILDGEAPSPGTDTADLVVTVTGVNDAPVLSGANAFEGVVVNDPVNDGNAVSELTGTITDVDNGAIIGAIAVTGTTVDIPGAAVFQYSRAGGTWTDIGAVDANNGLLLLSTDRIRFSPNGTQQVTGSIDFKAWDQTGTTFGLEGTKVNTVPDGGESAFSTFVGTSTVTTINATIENGALQYGEEEGREDQVSIWSDGTSVYIHDANGPVTTDDGVQEDPNTVSFLIADFEDIRFEANDFDDTITVGDMEGFDGSLTIDGEEGFDSVTFAAGMKLALGTGIENGPGDENLDVDAETVKIDFDAALSVVGDGTIDIAATGGGAEDFIGIQLKRASLTSADGSITLVGEGGSVGNHNDGVQINVGSTITTAGGSVGISGTGTGTSGPNDGVSLVGGSDVTVGGAGTITIEGTSSGAGDSNGVLLFSGTEVTTAGGDISVAGVSAGTGARNSGIYTNGATVAAGGAGSISLDGEGGGTGSHGKGLRLTASSFVASGTGDITLAGTGGPGTRSNVGVEVGVRTSLATGSGDVTVTGEGGGTASQNTGVAFLSGSSVDSGGGITVAGTGGDGTSNNDGVSLISATLEAAGDISVTGEGAGGGNYNRGIDSTRSSIGGAGVTLTGTGTQSGGTSARFGDGVYLNRGGASAAGTLTIAATGGTGSSNNRGFYASGVTLGGTLAVTGTADAGTTGAGNSGVYILNSVLGAGTVEGTAGGGTGSFGADMNNITGGLAPGDVTGNATDAEDELVGNFFNVLPALLLAAGADRRRKEQLSGLIAKLGGRRASEGGVEIYREEDGIIGLEPVLAGVATLEEAGIEVPDAPGEGRQILVLTGDDGCGLSGVFARLDGSGKLVSTSPLENGLAVGAADLMEGLNGGGQGQWSRVSRETTPVAGRSFSEAFGIE